MKIDNQAWMTLFDPLFPTNQYLYHFTTIEKAVKILHSNTLKFSKTGSLNDTLESKPKLSSDDFMFSGDFKRFSAALIHFRKINHDYLQILCFSKDLPSQSRTHINERKLYTDYSGRGFAFPRMWAQYAGNNAGICFVFDKKTLCTIIEKSVGSLLIHSDDVEYINQFQHYEMYPNRIMKLAEQIKQQSELQGSIATIDFLRNNTDFVKYNYFSKLDDWASENEFRFLGYGDSVFFVKDIFDALVGVVLGEMIAPYDEEIVKYFCHDVCEIKKITFAYKGCQLENVH